MPRQVDPDAQRAHLLDACLRTFVEEGYVGASMRKLASAAGVSTGALYHWFPDKLSLLSALWERLVTTDAAAAAADLPADAPVPVRIRALFAFLRARRGHLQDLLRLALDVQRHEPGAEVSAAVAAYRAQVRVLLDLDDARLAGLAFDLIVGALITGLLDPSRDTLDDAEAIVQATWARIESGLAA
jgi:AcrR family transcriptional regulator